MTEPVQVYPPHAPVPGPCDSATCEGGDHVCTVCGGGVSAFTHLPEARGEQTETATVQAGAAATLPVQSTDVGTGGEANR